ncbi:hypothetical protein [uncultured Draconibacterium sp.]|uniref:hypothetical protein n=1 Tax=uncultured Draconibacterium sp. TaxID=1573823 RepID=UPI0025F556F0|nr:hypothetical protein [uncultured Draconibacterium sp.]
MNKPLYILLAFFLTLPAIASSQNYLAGARFIALSNACVSVSDTWSTFHNQATLTQQKSVTTGLFYESKYGINEFALAATSVVLPTKTGNFGLGFYQFGKGSFKNQKIGLAYAKQLSKTISAAVQFDYFLERLPENPDAFSFFTFELGAIYKVNHQVTLGVHSFNPVKNGFSYPEGKKNLPSVYRLGAHYVFEEHILLSLETQKETNNDFAVRSGLEFMPLSNLAIRFGISGRPLQYTAGFGYQLKNISTDIAFSYHGNLGFTPSVALQYHFK